jgi:tetratricopeptide (TPR) repeat protein
MLQPRPAIAILVLLALSDVGKAQTSVSASSGGLAHDCFIAALRSTQTGASVKDGVTGCSAALAGPLTAEARAATYDNRGILYDADKNYSSAWADFNTAIRINPALGDPYLNRGVALIRLHRAEEALADIKKGMSLGASLPQIGYYDLAVAASAPGHAGPDTCRRYAPGRGRRQRQLARRKRHGVGLQGKPGRQGRSRCHHLPQAAAVAGFTPLWGGNLQDQRAMGGDTQGRA